MIGNAAQAYQRAIQKLADIESRCAAADAYLMRMVLANSRYALANMITTLLPLGTPFETLYTQDGLTAIFAPFMKDVALIAGAEPTVVPEPQGEKAALLMTVPMVISAIRDLLHGVGASAYGYSEIDTALEDTSGLADNVATIIRSLGWQFAWPLCIGSFRETSKVFGMKAVATSASDEVVISESTGTPLGASGMSNWDKPRANDRFLVSDLSALTVFTTTPSVVSVKSVAADFSDMTVVMDGVATGSETADTQAYDYYAESLGAICLRKISTT